MSDGFTADDRKKVTLGTLLTVIGGIFLASFKAMGFVLRAVFGGNHYGLFAIAQNLTEMLAYFLVGGFNDAIVYLGARNIEGRHDPAVQEHQTSAPHDALTDAKPDATSQRAQTPPQASSQTPVIANEDGLYRTMATCLMVPLALSLIIVLGVQLFLPKIYALWWSNHDPMLMNLIRILIFALPFLLISQLASEALKIFLDFRWQVGVVQVLVPTATAIYATLLFTVGGMGIEALVWALLFATMTAAPIALYGFSRRFSLWRTVSYFFRGRLDREVLDFAVPQSLNMMLNLGMVRLDSLMLSGFVSADSVGIYSLISDLTQLIRLAKMAFSSVFSPLVARYQAQNNRDGIRIALHTLVRFTSSLAIPLLLVMMIMYPHFVLSSEETWAYDRWFPWLLAVGPLMSCFFGLAGNLLLMTGHARLLLFNAVVSSILNVILNLALIPHYGLFGAALATAISNFAISFMQIVEMWKIEHLTMPLRLYVWTLTAGALPLVMAAGVFTDVGQSLVAMMPGSSAFMQAGMYAGAAIVIYLVVLFLPPGGLHKAPLDWLRSRLAAKSNAR